MNIFDFANLTPDMTVGNFLHYWYNTFAVRNIKQSTAISYRGYIEKHIVPVIGEIPLNQINTGVLQAFFNDRYDNGNSRGGGLSPKSLRNIELMLHKSFQKAVDLELMRRNFVEGVELPKQTEPQMRVLTRSEQRKLLKVLRSSDEKLAFGAYISITTGMRLGEVLGLKWGDIDLVANIIYIRRTVNRLQTLDGDKKTEIVVGTPKSRNSIRNIPFTDKLNKEFVKYRQKSAEWLEHTPKDTDFIISLQYGKPIEPKTMQTVFERIVDAAGIEPANFHALRHTFATRAVENNVDVKTLSTLLGHADIGTTLNRYVHIMDEQKRNTMDKLLDDMLDDEYDRNRNKNKDKDKDGRDYTDTPQDDDTDEDSGDMYGGAFVFA